MCTEYPFYFLCVPPMENPGLSSVFPPGPGIGLIKSSPLCYFLSPNIRPRLAYCCRLRASGRGVGSLNLASRSVYMVRLIIVASSRSTDE